MRLVTTIKLLLATLASNPGVSFLVPALLLLVQLSANMFWKVSESGQRTWAPATHLKDEVRILVPGFNIAQAWLLKPSGGVKLWMEDRCPHLCHSN